MFDENWAYWSTDKCCYTPTTRTLDRICVELIRAYLEAGSSVTGSNAPVDNGVRTRN